MKRKKPEDRARPQQKESAHDVLHSIGSTGVAKGLPSDLSMNKAYFEGFGRSDPPRASRHRVARRTPRA